MTLNIEVGKTYLTQDDSIVTITEWDKVDETDQLPFLGSNYIWYPANGMPFINTSSNGRFNLVKEI